MYFSMESLVSETSHSDKDAASITKKLQNIVKACPLQAGGQAKSPPPPPPFRMREGKAHDLAYTCNSKEETNIDMLAIKSAQCTKVKSFHHRNEVEYSPDDLWFLLRI